MIVFDCIVQEMERFNFVLLLTGAKGRFSGGFDITVFGGIHNQKSMLYFFILNITYM